MASWDKAGNAPRTMTAQPSQPASLRRVDMGAGVSIGAEKMDQEITLGKRENSKKTMAVGGHTGPLLASFWKMCCRLFRAESVVRGFRHYQQKLILFARFPNPLALLVDVTKFGIEGDRREAVAKARIYPSKPGRDNHFAGAIDDTPAFPAQWHSR